MHENPYIFGPYTLCRQIHKNIYMKVGTFPDEESPLWEISARDLTSKMQFEIVLTMEGITPETGNTIQVEPSLNV